MDNRFSFTRGDMHVLTYSLTYSLNQSTCLMAHLLLPHTMLPSVKQIVPTASNWSSSEDLRKNGKIEYYYLSILSLPYFCRQASRSKTRKSFSLMEYTDN